MNVAPPTELLRALATATSKHGWRWYVFGTQAVVAYGRPRMTGDVDATVALGRGSPRRLVDALRTAGFALCVRDAESFVAVTRVFPFLHEASGMPLDLVLAGPGLLRMTEQALDQSDLSPLFEALLATAQPKPRKRPPANAKKK